MELSRNITVIILTFVTICHLVDGLIGLRPPPKRVKQDEKNEKKRVMSTTIGPTDIVSVHNSTNPYKPIDIKYIQCHPVPLLRCSYKLLKDSILNDSHICRHAQHFSRCIRTSIRSDGRRDFVIGLDILDDFSRTTKRQYNCHGNTSLSLLQHTRHQRAKRYGSPCCTDGIIDCGIQTFYKMIQNQVDKCQFVEFYEICLQEVQKNCQMKSISSAYPVFTSQLNRKCNAASRHRRHTVINVKYS